MLVPSIEPPRFRLSLPPLAVARTCEHDYSDDDSLCDDQAVVNSCREDGVCEAAAGCGGGRGQAGAAGGGALLLSAAASSRQLFGLRVRSLSLSISLRSFSRIKATRLPAWPANTESVSAQSLTEAECYVGSKGARRATVWVARN